MREGTCSCYARMAGECACGAWDEDEFRKRESRTARGYFTIDDIVDAAESIWPERLVRNLSWAAVAAQTVLDHKHGVGPGTEFPNLTAAPVTATAPDGSVTHGISLSPRKWEPF